MDFLSKLKIREKEDDNSFFEQSINKNLNKKRNVIKVLGLVFLFLSLIIFIVGILFYRVFSEAKVSKNQIEKLKQSFLEKDLDKVKEQLSQTGDSFLKLKNAYKKIAWLKYIPYLGTYISDGEHVIEASILGQETASLMVDTIYPYAYFIGFKTSKVQSQQNDRTTQDSIDFIISSLPDLVLKYDELSKRVLSLKKEVDKINPDRYPKKIFDIPLREKILRGKEFVDLVGDFVARSKPLLEVFPYILGVENERRYLLLFQNDKELRPTGGFITAYSIAKVNKGKFEPVVSNDIYNLDNLYRPKVEAPEPIRKYLKGPYLISKYYRLRDMNWSPDFFESMSLFTQEAKDAGIKNIDGVIAIDTHTLVNILNVLGEIYVPGYGGYSNNIVELCKCPQVVYELENFADLEGPIVWSENEPGKIVYAPPNYDNRKKIIGPMMNTILKDLLGLPAEKMPALFEAISKSVLEKHILVFMFDQRVQKALEEFGIAGRIKDYEGDYLLIVDANLGGRKSNLYATQEVVQKIEKKNDSKLVKTLEITYKNPMRQDGWLNSILPNWLRIYVPKGSKLISINGLEDVKSPYEEFGKTVFSGFFELRPQGIAKVEVKYELPQDFGKEYRLFVQKQPGKDRSLYTIEYGKKTEEYWLSEDKEFILNL